MVSVEEELQAAEETLRQAERRLKLYAEGITESDLIIDKLTSQVNDLKDSSEFIQQVIDKVRGDLSREDSETFDKRLDIISRTEALIESLEDFTIDVLSKGVADIKQLLTDMDKRMADDAVNVELEAEALKGIADYMRRWSK